MRELPGVEKGETSPDNDSAGGADGRRRRARDDDDDPKSGLPGATFAKSATGCTYTSPDKAFVLAMTPSAGGVGFTATVRGVSAGS